MSQAVRDDPVKMHKEANALFESGKFKDAEELFAKTADLYLKVQNYFDSTTMRYKAGECAFALKEYEKAVEHFEKSAELSFQKGFDRFGVSALEYERDCYKSLGKRTQRSKCWTGRFRKSRRNLRKHSRRTCVCFPFVFF